MTILGAAGASSVQMRKIPDAKLIWLAVLAVALIGGGVLALTWRGKRAPIAPATPSLKGVSSLAMQLRKVRMHGVQGGSIIWEADADSFDMARSSPVMRLHGMRRCVMLDGTKTALSLAADTLERNTISGDMTLGGQVAVTGTGLDIRTTQVQWQAYRAALFFPQKVIAQMGDLTLISAGNATAELRDGVLRCQGPVTLATGGNVIKAGEAEVNIRTRAFTLSNLVTADMQVADMTAWMGGTGLPKIAPIPQSILERYRLYCAPKGK